MFNQTFSVKSALSFLTRFSAFLLSYTSFLSYSQTNIFKMVFCLMIISHSVEPLTINHRSKMNLYHKRAERSVLIFSENHDVLSTIYIKPNLKDSDHLFLTESNNQITLAENSRDSIKAGHFLIESIPKKMLEKYKNRTLINTDLVIIRKYYSNTCICMNSNGIIYTQVSLKLSNVGDCGWYLEETAYGIRFINFLNSVNLNQLWFMAICKNRHLSVCRHIGKNGNMSLNTFWTVGKITVGTQEEIPYTITRHRFNYPSLLASMQEKSNLLCDGIKIDLTKIVFEDIEESLKINNEFQMSMAYLRFFLLSHQYTKRDIKEIFQKIQEIIKFYGQKTRKKIFRIFKNSHFTSRCSMDYLKYCSTFQSTKRSFKTMRHNFSRTNRYLIRLLMPLTNLNYLEKLKWLKKGDFLDFIRDTLLISLPPKEKIMKASFFLLQYTNSNDPFKVDSQHYNQSRYFDLFFARKIEELSFGAAISMKNSSITVLEKVYEKLTLLNSKNQCLKTIVQTLHKHSKCSTKAYLYPCVIFSSTNRLYKS